MPDALPPTRVPDMRECPASEIAVGDRIRCRDKAAEVVAIECRLTRLRFTLGPIRDGKLGPERWERSMPPLAMVLCVSRLSH